MASPVRIVFLGGLGEIGRNSAAVELEGRILLIDCGLMFPNLDMLGVDLVLPDFTWLHENADRIEACVVTHGHEDHHGGLNFLLRDARFPIYGSELTLAIAKHRIIESGLKDRTSFNVVADGERIQVGPFDLEFIPVAHSVPHGFATAIRTPQGVVLHSGDFKIDLHPVDGRRTDLGRLGAISDEEGVRLFLCDSTNAEEAGTSPSETSVGAVLRDVFAKHPDERLITACFSSHIHRVQQIADAAIANGRTVATLGLSMKRNVAVAREMGVLRIPDGKVVDIADVGDLADHEVCIICTGSQGEPMSALSRMAAGENRWVTVGEGDVIVFSSHAIPGNEADVNRVINDLHKRGADVIHSGLEDVHATGHAQADELTLVHSLVDAEWFIPVHGEYRHLVHHARLAERVGMDPDNIVICADGDVVTLDDDGVRITDEVPSGYLYVDGIVGDINHGVLRDRRVLAAEGVVVVVVATDAHTGEVIAEPEIITKGWVHADEAEDLFDELRTEVRKALEEAAAKGALDHDSIRRHARKAVGSLVNQRTRRRPMIVPVVMEA